MIRSKVVNESRLQPLPTHNLSPIPSPINHNPQFSTLPSLFRALEWVRRKLFWVGGWHSTNLVVSHHRRLNRAARAIMDAPDRDAEIDPPLTSFPWWVPGCENGTVPRFGGHGQFWHHALLAASRHSPQSVQSPIFLVQPPAPSLSFAVLARDPLFFLVGGVWAGLVKAKQTLEGMLFLSSIRRL